MIFQATYMQVLDGTKTQTRRIMNGETFIENHLCQVVSVYKNGRLKWQVGKTYGVQSGRCKSSLAWIRITAIRRERLQSISDYEAIREGIYREIVEIDEYGSERCLYSHGLWSESYFTPINAYRSLWDSIHTKTGERWADNPLVWVLDFELVKV